MAQTSEAVNIDVDSLAQTMGRCFICNTPAAYAVVGVLQRPVESILQSSH